MLMVIYTHFQGLLVALKGCERVQQLQLSWRRVQHDAGRSLIRTRTF